MDGKVMTNQKRIYIVLSQTGTVLSRILKVLYKREYNHASISISDNMEPMYSFGRLNAYNPFYAGFVEESCNWGTFKRFYKTKAKILAIDVSSDAYDGVCDTIKEIIGNKSKYKYNYKGLFYAFFNVFKEFDKSFYCSEFIKYILIKSNIDGCERLPNIIHPVDFTVISHTVIYEGLLNEYKVAEKVTLK